MLMVCRPMSPSVKRGGSRCDPGLCCAGLESQLDEEVADQDLKF